MDLDREGLSRIKELLKNNPRGMNVTEIAREIGMNRLSVAKYLEMLVISGHLDVKAFGPSKVYFLSQRLPISAMLSLSSDFIIILDKDLRIINVNDKFLEFTNFKRNDILFQKLDTLSFPLEFRPSLIPSVSAALNGQNHAAEAYFKKREKESFFNIKFIPLVFDDGQKGVTLLFEDITERKRIELAIKESELKLRSIIDQSLDGIILTDERGRIIEYNQGEEEMIGISREKAIGAYIWDFQASLIKDMRDKPEFRERIKSSMQKSLRSGKNPEKQKYMEFEIDRPDGSKRAIHIMTFSIQTDKGYMVCGITRDITERKRDELKLRESETQFRAIFEQAAVGIAYVDENDRIKSTNKRFCDILGYEESELVGLTYKDISYPVDIIRSEEYLKRMKAHKISSYSLEKRYFRKDGSIVWANVTVSSLNTHDADSHHIVIIEDIMARKQAEEALLKAELHLAKAQTIAQVGSWEVVSKDSSPDLKHVDVQWSDEMYRILGLDPKSRTTAFSQFLDLVHPEDREIVTGIRSDLVKDHRSDGCDVRILIREGIEKILHLESGVDLADNGKLAKLYGTVQDVTERRRMEEALRKAHDELEKTVDERTLELNVAIETLQSEISQKIQIEESLRQSEADLKNAQKIAHLGFWQTDIKNNICQWSDGNYTILDYGVGECMPCIDSWLARVHPDDRDLVFKKINGVMNDDTLIVHDYRVIHRDGSIHYMHDETSPPIKDEAGNPVKIFGTIQDVTEIRQAEAALREKQEKLEIQAEELRMNNNKLEQEIQSRKLAQEALQESEIRFRSLIQNSSDIIRILDKNGLIIYDSPSSGKILGYPDGYMIGRSPYDFINPEDLDRVRKDLVEVYENKNIGVPTEFRIRKADGKYLDVESIGMNMIGVTGVDGIVTTTRAITERKRAEEAIHASEYKYRNLVENITDGAWELDKNLAYTYMSPRSITMIGYAPEELLGKTPYDLMDTEEAKRVNGLLHNVALAGLSFSLFECKLLHKDGHIVHVEISCDPVFDSKGDFSGYRGVTRDVTQRNRDKEELSNTNRALRLLSDCNHALIRSNTEQDLLANICNILVEVGGYRLAWVGYKGHDEQKSIRPIAHAGQDNGYIEAINLKWSDDGYSSMGPGGMAIRNCSPCILRWDGLNAQFMPWSKEALNRGLSSIIGLPLMGDGQTFGVLLIYSDQIDAFNDTEVELLKELSDNVSYGVTAIRARSKH